MTELPAGWRLRRPTLDDVPAILRLAHASDIAAIGEPDFTVDEVREALTGPHTDLDRDCWLALDPGGDIVGWAYPDNATGADREFLEVYVWPERGIPAQQPLLELLLGRAAERAAEFGHETYTLRAGAVPTELPWIDVLTGAGFTFLKQHARMTMQLADLAPYEPPPGVTVRPVDPEQDLPRVHATIEEAFRDTDHRATDFATWQDRIAAESTVSWDEWFVAHADGEWAGVLQSAPGMTTNQGWIRALAVLRPHRRRGVGEALLRRALTTYATKGHTEAGLGVDMSNPTQAARLYLRAGLTPLYQVNIYHRPL